jgi:GTP cyclohydrolase III
MGQTVRGLEVSAEKHDDIVIFVDNQSQGESTFYLVSARGGARRVVSVKAGVGYGRTPTAADRTALATEKQHWLDRLVPSAPLQTGKH